MNLDDKTFLEAVGQRIRKRRKSLGFTVLQLADKTGLDRTFLGAIERGTRNIGLLNLRLVARTLRLRLSDLFDDIR